MRIKYQISNIKNTWLKFYILICSFAFLFLIFIFSLDSTSAYAWKLPIEVSIGAENCEKVYNRLVVGIEPDATDDFDNLWDTPALTSRPDPDSPLVLRAYLNGKESVGVETRPLWKDIRGAKTSGDTAWEITIGTVPQGKRVVISWDVPQGLFKKGERLVLKDNEKAGDDGEPIKTDMTQASNYEFVSNGEGSRSLSLVYSKDRQPSGCGSGFGCGTIRSDKEAPPDDGAAATSMVLLLLPIAVIKLIHLTRLRLSI